MLKKSISTTLGLIIVICCHTPLIYAQNDALTKAASGLKLRGIGPALMGGRIADIAVHPNDRSTWYVAVGSGGLWKTHKFRHFLETGV